MYKLFCFVLIGLLAISCGNGESQTAASSEQESSAPTQSNPETSAASSAGPALEIQLSSNDLMQYDQTELRAKAGQSVTLTLKHTGTMAKNVMGHNFVLLKQGVDLADFALKAVAAIDNDYIPEGDEIIAHTELIGGGESTTITFTAPAAGTYEYLCSFPGHYGLMKGQFIVEE